MKIKDCFSCDMRYWRKEKLYCKARLNFKPGCKVYKDESWGKPKRKTYADFKGKLLDKVEDYWG